MRHSPLISLLRGVRNLVAPPAWYRRQRDEARFYRQFVPAGGLCFDIGANVGDKTQCFRQLGSKVVAVEPVPATAAHLRSRFEGDPDVTVAMVAVGAKPATAIIYLGETSTTSSLSKEWIETAQHTQRLGGRQWPDQALVEVTTLDALIAAHGLPSFCKIDVEGFELPVLQGLSSPVTALSVEVQPETLDATWRVMDRLSELGRYRYRFTFSDPLAWETEWLDSEAFKVALARLTQAAPERWGDFFAVLETRS